MSTYRNEWPCCGSVTETEAWEPEHCPFCTPDESAQAAPARGAMEWQPIETAPRGSGENGPGDTRHPDYVAPPRVLLSTAEGIVVGYYDWYYHPGYGAGAAPDESVWRDNEGGRTFGVTHWMPLPAAPGIGTTAPAGGEG